jgi:hypothetical protein
MNPAVFFFASWSFFAALGWQFPKMVPGSRTGRSRQTTE